MDYFFQEQRWTDTFLSLHVKKFKRIILFLLIAFSAAGTKAQSDVKFNDGVRYSQWVIDSRMNEFYANTTKCGFAVYDQNGTQTSARVDGKTSLDYVVGLVAKSIIEASQYYSQFTWAQSFAKPWFLSIQNYGNKFYSGVATSGGSLDDLNAVKLYLPLRELTKSGGTFEDNTTYSNTATALNKAITGLKAHNSSYSIKSGTLAETAGNTVTGGWWHKKDYQNQMWLDGAYMGPALFAELVNYSGTTKNIDSSNDWDLIVKQFTILRNMCWNPTDKLPYHAFAADGGTNSTSHSDTWAGLSSKSPYCFHSASYWGRAVGWYFLALVDILEQMDKAKLTSTEGYTTLKGYLAETADGLKARQDQKTGGWYQILDETDAYSASSYNGKSYTQTYNYIESSATALFTAAYLKAIRLGYLAENDYKTVAVNGYKCLVNQFFSVDENGKVNIFGSCRSAGLGGSGNDYKPGAKKFRDGSKPYYLLGSDVARVDKSENVTEGKVLGAFILAATEYERQYQSPMLLSNDLNSTYTLSSNESLSAEVLGEGTATYQWFDATGTTPSAIDGATNASYTPTKSGKYYCVITVTPTSTAAKTRAASTSGSYTITTSTADVTVSEVTPPSESANAVVWTFTNSTLTSGTLGKENNEVKFTCTDGSSTVMTYVSGSSDAIVSSSKTINDVTYSSYLKENGAGSVDGKRRMEFNAPSSKGTVTIVYAGTAGTTNVIDGSNGNKELATLTGKTNTDVTTDVLTTTVGNKIIIYCPKKSYIYSVIWTPINEPTGPSISISTQPASADYVTGATVKPLTVVATLDGYTLSYQWYENTTNSNTGGTEISGATTNIYTPTLPSTAGTTYYYCVVTATKEGSETLTATSDVAAITVSEPYVKFNTQPTSGSYAINVAASALKVVAATNLGVDITYQWYSNSSATTEGATQITDATSSSYTPSTSTVGTTYYYCIATAKKDGTTVTATSNIVSVTVATAIYSYKVEKSGITAPKINTSLYITDNSKNKLIKMTFGGWKWNGGKYIKPNTTTEITDSWNNSTGGNNIASIDNYQYWFEGTQDAVDESKALTGTIYGTLRYGWFVSPTRDADGKTTVSHPYTLPVRGSFMTFEPTMNGTLSIYILQNGAWNTNRSGTYTDTDGVGTITYSNGQIAAGEFRPHAFHVVNQRGLTVQEFSPKYSVETMQKVNTKYYCMFKGDKGFDQTRYDDPHNVARWKEFAEYMSPAEQQRCHDNWNNGDGGAQTIIELDNGSFLAIEKGITKYTFHVTGNETYYFFSNFSKMGFSGATFQPDADSGQPTDVATFSGDNSLSDTKAYTEITMTEDGKIGETGLTNYKYTIGGEEVGKVEGVFIPQFRAITLKRTFKPNQWTTLSLPFNLTQTEVEQIFGKGTQIIVFDKAKITSARTYLTFFYHEIQNVLPGYPYLIRPTLVDADGKQMVTKSNSADYAPTYTINTEGNLTEFTVYNKAINPHINQHEFTSGDYTAKCTPSYCTAGVTGNGKDDYSKRYKKGDIFVSEGKGTVYISEGQSYGKGYRSYIEYTGTTPPSAKALSISFSGVEDDDDNGTTTEIRVTELADDVIETLGIGGVYNLNGQKVADTTRNLPAGIYIVNGRKVVVK